MKKAKIDKLNQERALEQLDKMMDDFMDNDLPGMCLAFAPPPNSRSDGHIANQKRNHWLVGKATFKCPLFRNSCQQPLYNCSLLSVI